MNAQYVEVDISELKQFSERLRRLANGELKDQLAKFLDATGFEMLKVIEDEIIRLKVVDTRLLLNSFHKGSEGNVYELDEGNLKLEIGTNVEYAQWVNDGHATIGPGGGFIAKDGYLSRFVPGVWHGDRFEYIPGAKTGMLLHQQWIEGKHYMEHAVNAMERIFPQALERFLDNFLKSYFP